MPYINTVTQLQAPRHTHTHVFVCMYKLKYHYNTILTFPTECIFLLVHIAAWYLVTLFAVSFFVCLFVFPNVTTIPYLIQTFPTYIGCGMVSFLAPFRTTVVRWCFIGYSDGLVKTSRLWLVARLATCSPPANREIPRGYTVVRLSSVSQDSVLAKA